MHTNPNALSRFRDSDIILNLHADASYLLAPHDRSRVGGYILLGSLPQDGENAKLNANITITYANFKIVTDAETEAKLGSLFLNTQEVRII